MSSLSNLPIGAASDPAAPFNRVEADLDECAICREESDDIIRVRNDPRRTGGFLVCIGCYTDLKANQNKWR